MDFIVTVFFESENREEQHGVWTQFEVHAFSAVHATQEAAKYMDQWTASDRNRIETVTVHKKDQSK